MEHTSRAKRALTTALVLSSLLLAGCSSQAEAEMGDGLAAPGQDQLRTAAGPRRESPSEGAEERRTPPPDEPARGRVTLGFAGDVHFEYHLRSYLDGRRPLGPITDVLQAPDLMMLNVETALTNRGAPERKLFNFRAPPRSLDTLRDAGVDLVTLANNHAADYGEVGVADSLAAVRRSGLPAVGFGADLEAALTPFTTEIRGTDIAVFGISDRPDSTASNWYARSDRPGIVAHRHIPRLAAAVREAGRTADVVVVYAHWGAELAACPNERQFQLVRVLSKAGVDVLVGTHAHVLQGSGWRGDTYVNYGLGSFVWYHNFRPHTGVLKLTIRDGEVVGDAFIPAEVQASGLTLPLAGADRAAAVAAWEARRGCTDLTAEPPSRRP